MSQINQIIDNFLPPLNKYIEIKTTTQYLKCTCSAISISICRTMIAVLLVILAILLLLLLIYHTNKNMNYMSKIPGPKPIFLLGNTLDFFNLDCLQVFHKMIRYFETYGTIVKLRMSATKWLLLTSDADLMEHIMTSPKLITKSLQYSYLWNWLGTGLLTSTGPKWKHRRRLITPSFHFSILEQFLGVFDKHGDILVRKLENFNNKNFDIAPLISLYTLDVICEAAMSTCVHAQSNETSDYVRQVKTMCEILLHRTVSPFPDKLYFLRPMSYKEKRALKVLHDYTDSIVEERLKSKNSELSGNETDCGIKKRMNFLDTLLQSQIEGQALTKEDLKEEVNTFMFEGHDTTASALAFTLYNLSTHPQVQDKVLQEQKDLFGDLTTKIKPTLTDLNNMKYLELVIKETLRLYPSVPILGRESIEDFEYNGTVYPKDMSILMVIFHMQRNAQYWPEPELFKPESAGLRNCIGQKFAMFEMKHTLSKILRKFKLTCANHALQLSTETILVSRNGVKIGLKPRQF